MKQYIYILLLCWLAIVQVSCYEDKGNYDYTTREDITVKGLNEEYKLITMSDTLDILPEIESPEDYDYIWLIYKIGTDFNYDTIGFTHHLKWPVNRPQGNYKLFLKVTARSDGFSQMFRSKLTITSTFSDGWFVVKDEEGETDIDFFTLDLTEANNILQQATGRKIPGKALNMSLLSGFSYIEPSGEILWGKDFFYVMTDKDCWMMKLEDMSFIRDFSTLFYGPAPAENLRTCVYGGYSNTHFFTDRNAYFVNTQATGTGQIGLNVDFKSEIEVGDYLIRNQAGAYFYDQRNQRFLGVNYNGIPTIISEDGKDGEIPPVKINHTGCSMLYMGISKYASEYCYAVMSNTTLSEKYIYTMYAPPLNIFGTYNLIKSVDRLDASLKINEATLFAIGSNLSYIYYNDLSGNAIHFYDILGKSEVKNVFPIPDGEKITYMKSLFYDSDDENDKFDKFVIATEAEGNYKVYLYDLLAGKPHPDKKPQILKGKGSVGSVLPIRATMNSNSANKTSCNF